MTVIGNLFTAAVGAIAGWLRQAAAAECAAGQILLAQA
jgi:hypothetical protein